MHQCKKDTFSVDLGKKPSGSVRVKTNIALRKRTLSPVRLVLEDSSIRSFFAIC
jgi:hypothetical protein